MSLHNLAGVRIDGDTISTGKTEVCQFELALAIDEQVLGLEISVIEAFADKIVALLKARDPLSEKVHLGPVELLAYSVGRMVSELTRRAMGRRPVSKPAAGA